MKINIIETLTSFNSTMLEIDKGSKDIQKVKIGDFIVVDDDFIEIIGKSEKMLLNDPPIPTGEFVLSCKKHCGIQPGEYEVIEQ
jgi:hypothetical protein